MKLYHGTTPKYLDQILREGILPRARSGSASQHDGHWTSKPGFVYLSTVYPAYFADLARNADDQKMVIFEVDASKIGPL